MTELSTVQSQPSRASLWGSGAFSHLLPFLMLLVIGLTLPLFAGGYWGVIATRFCVYWVLVAGLNLLVGFAGQLAIGWVALRSARLSRISKPLVTASCAARLLVFAFSASAISASPTCRPVPLTSVTCSADRLAARRKAAW